MPVRKEKSSKTTPAVSTDPDTALYFPFARYTSIVGVHTVLLAFSALLLPSTSPSLSTFVGWESSSFTERRPERNVVQSLTRNPRRTVAWICLGALILQVWWASWIKNWSNNTQMRKADSAEELQRRIERNTWKARLQPALEFGPAATMTLAASAILNVITVLFGAPIASYPVHTYLMSLLLAILTVLPPAYALGPPSLGSDSPSLVSRLTWIRLFAELSPRTPLERALVYPAVGAVTGCWAGAIPIGLDWERPWQAWPLTPAFGAVGGFIVGSLVALVVSATLELAKEDPEIQRAQRQAQVAKSKKKSKNS